MSQSKAIRLLTPAIAVAAAAFANPSVAQEKPLSHLSACTGGAFSTEEDFMTGGKKPFDGNPYISDGDILSPNGEVCARNRELVQRYDVTQDLGLDALDILDFDARIVAFSTELDSPHGNFGAGDLLITDGMGLGVVIPNSALTAAFNIRNDVGLDEVKLIGPADRLRRFVTAAAGVPSDGWQDGRLQSLVKELRIDIWFSIEGTVFDRERPILDGDILSVTGAIVATNRDLLAPAAPAGLPNDGVDFGLDALAAPRTLPDDVKPLATILFSTEVNFSDKISFTDGDVLNVGGTIVATNQDLVSAFAPKAKFLGLDALWFPFEVGGDPRITTLCDRSVGDFNGGITFVGGPGTGLYEQPLSSPPALTDTYTAACGRYVPIDGGLPVPPTGVQRFRVAYREAGEPIPATPGDPATPAIDTMWHLKRGMWKFIPMVGWQWVCEQPATLATSAGGWMNAQDYIDAKNGIGSYIGCPNPELRLAVWNTLSLPAGTPVGDPVPGVRDREDHYVVWLEWEDSSSSIHREPVDHHLQLDNTLPVIAKYPDGLQIRLADGTLVPACGETPAGTADLEVWGQFRDRHYEHFALSLKGGLPPATAGYGPHFYYDPTDGTAGVKNTDDTGTVPDGTTVHLRDISLNDLGESFQDCCYYLELRAFDRVIRHAFNGTIVNDITGSVWSEAFMTFAAAP